MLFISSFTGIWGVSALVWLANLGAAKIATDALARRRFAPAHGAAALGVLALTASSALTSAPLPTPKQAASGAAQTGEPLVAALQTTSGDLSELDGMMGSFRAKTVVWPELAAIAIAREGDTSKLREYAGRTGLVVITSFEDGSKPKPFNVSSAIGPFGESARYRKRKLFGGETSMHQAGGEAVAVEAGGKRIGLNVCFDSCFPSVIRESALTSGAAPDYITLPCMGPESPHGFLQAVHGAYTTFRSAECGVPIVRAESSAYAMITGSHGEILAFAPEGYEGAIEAQLPRTRDWTLYRQFGDWFLWCSWIGTGLWLVAFTRSAREELQSPLFQHSLREHLSLLVQVVDEWESGREFQLHDLLALKPSSFITIERFEFP